ncbi:Strongly-conserved Zn-finger binding protein (TFIIIA) [Ceratobasidium sp. 392]|nr:Strongly-conserved Zn-finger binding protein (TFIIIA) [Ceratobasidium sp. 392]
MGRQSVVPPANSRLLIRDEPRSSLLAYPRKVHGVAVAKDPQIVVDNNLDLTRRQVGYSWAGSSISFAKSSKPDERLMLYRTASCKAYTNCTSYPNSHNTTFNSLHRLPVSGIRTVLLSPTERITDNIAEQIKLSLGDPCPPPPSYDSLFSSLPIDRTPKAETKAHLSLFSTLDVPITVPSGERAMLSDLDVQLSPKTEPVEDKGALDAVPLSEVGHRDSISVIFDETSGEPEPNKVKHHIPLGNSDDRETIPVKNPPGDIFVQLNFLLGRSPNPAPSRPCTLLNSLSGRARRQQPPPIWNPRLTNDHRSSPVSSPASPFAQLLQLLPSSFLRKEARTHVSAIQALSNTLGGGLGASSAQPNFGPPSGHNELGGSFSQHNGEKLWSGQGPGHDSADIENEQLIMDFKHDTLKFLAQELGYRLVPAQDFDLIRASLGSLFDLAPQPPVPLRASSSPNISFSIPPETAKSRSNCGIAYPCAQSSATRSSFGEHSGIQNSSLCAPCTSTASYPQLGTGDAASPDHIISAFPNDLLFDLSINPEDQSSAVPQPTENTELPGVVSGTLNFLENTTEQLLNAGPSGYPGAYQCGAEQLPENTVSPMPTKASSSSAVQNTPPVDTASTPQTGPIRTIKWTPCPVDNCTKRFRRPYLLDAHLLSRHSGKKAFPCTFEGCDKVYTLKTNMQRHYKSIHPGFDYASGSGTVEASAASLSSTEPDM